MKPSEANPVLLAMDCVSFHKTGGGVLETLKQNWCQVVMILPGCIGIPVNKGFKAVLTRLEEKDATGESPLQMDSQQEKNPNDTLRRRGIQDSPETACRHDCQVFPGCEVKLAP